MMESPLPATQEGEGRKEEADARVQQCLPLPGASALEKDAHCGGAFCVNNICFHFLAFSRRPSIPLLAAADLYAG